MKEYRNVVAKAYLHALPDQKGDPATCVLTLYENAVTGLTGTIIGAATVTGNLTSLSGILLETEIKSQDMSKRYLYAKVTAGTPTQVAVTVERAMPRYEPV